MTVAFFLGYLVAISFPIEFDVWVRLCTHFEAAKVMTFASVTQHLSVQWHIEKLTGKTFLFFLKGLAKGQRRRNWEREDTGFPVDISKEVENNTITRVNAYARQYVPRRNVAAGGSNVGGGSSGRSWILPLCVYTFVCVEIKTKRETVAVGVLENV